MAKRTLSVAAVLGAAAALGWSPSAVDAPKPVRRVCTLTPPVAVGIDCTDDMNGRACLCLCVTPRIALEEVHIQVTVDGREVGSCWAGGLARSQSHVQNLEVSYPGRGGEVVVTVRGRTRSGEPVSYATGLKVGNPAPATGAAGRRVQTADGLKGKEYAVEPR